MAILNSKQLWAERNRLAEEQRHAVDDKDESKALVIQGQIEQLDITIGHVIEEEDKLRNAPKPAAKPADSFGVRILGPRDEFAGLTVGFKNSAEVGPRNAAASVVTVGAPTEIELEIPAKLALVYQNFASTLLETPAAGSITYKQRDKTNESGAPATWGGVTEGASATKQKVIYAWKDAVANKETIAGYVPISKDTLMDYDELLDIIEHDLLLDLDEITNGKYWSGSSSTGINGIVNTTGIQTFTEAMGGMYFDAIRKMRTKVMTNARRVPTHVAVSPEVREAIDLYKTETGLYQTLGSDVYWGMQVVEDASCPGILVYDSFAARRRAIHGGTTVEIGYYNDQFIKNELSILSEHTKALQVRYPDAFCLAEKEDLDKAPTVSAGGGAGQQS